MTNKLLLALIALGLFANAGAMLVRPAKADAFSMIEFQVIGRMAASLEAIAENSGACAHR